MHKENAVVLAEIAAPGGRLLLSIPFGMSDGVTLYDALEQFHRILNVVNIEHAKTIQLGIFRLAPFSMTGTGVALQRLIALGDEACRKDPCREFLLQLRFLVVQLVIGCTPLLLGLHLGRHPADFLDLLRDEGVVYRLVEVFAGCRYAVRISFLFEVKHIFKGCAISVYAQSAGL